MVRRVWLSAMCLVCSGLAMGQDAPVYKPDWTAQNFYAAVEGCREFIFVQGFKHTTETLIAKHASASMTAEAITAKLQDSGVKGSPAVDWQTTPYCFCEINEAAKSVTHAEFARKRSLSPKCKVALESVEKPPSDAMLEKLILK